jgi:hypothetical protein
MRIDVVDMDEQPGIRDIHGAGRLELVLGQDPIERPSTRSITRAWR